MRKISLIVIHCTATVPEMDVHVCDVRKWHIDRGFEDIGYHYLITRGGIIEIGRTEGIAGAHAKGYNSNSIGIALAGGINKAGKPENNFTGEQFITLKSLLGRLYSEHGRVNTVGHNEISEKDCPCFDVKEFLKEV